jgi:dephospho-CoA kinase
MIILGVTGSLGTGKSFVASVLRSLGAKVLDADRMAHESLAKGSASYKRIVKLFGSGVLDKSGKINRSKLAGLVFKNKQALKKLNGIIHPDVIRKIKYNIRKAREDAVVVIDAPLLVEARLTGMVDKLIVVKASKKNQYRRCARSLGIGKEECERRLRNQMPLAKKLKLADYVIRNDHTKSRTRSQVKQIWRQLWR